MAFTTVSLNPQTTPVVNEILTNFAFAECKMVYIGVIDNTFKDYWGEEIDDEEYNWNGYIDANWHLVEDGKISNDIKFWLIPEKKEYIEKNILNANLYMTRYSSYDEFELTVEYLFSAGEEDECLVEFVIDMSTLGTANKVTMDFDDEAVNNAQVTFLLLTQI